ncbi:MAG TPA: alpha/beta fold hydrolase [Labilithrix sp.]|nr:alpha/beta fold hydrolase [Labilithrix sp.]
MSKVARHIHAQVDGVRLHWAELRAGGDGVPLVLLHGLYDSHRTWDFVAPELARDRAVLMPDLPGHGLSDRPDASYQLVWHARIVARWLDSIGVGQIDLVGHSFGGGVAQMFLREYPARVRRLVLVAAGGLGREICAALRLASVPGIVESLGQPFMGIGTYLALLRTRGFTTAEIRMLAAMNAEPGSARAFARTVRDIIDWRGQRRAFFDHAHEIAELPPIAVLWGVADKIIPIAHGRAFAERIEGVVFVPFEGCGHYLHRERPDAFVRVVRTLLVTPSASAPRLRPPTAPPPPHTRVQVALATCPDERGRRTGGDQPGDGASTGGGMLGSVRSAFRRRRC